MPISNCQLPIAMKKSDQLDGEEVSAILNGGNGSTACAADGPPRL